MSTGPVPEHAVDQFAHSLCHHRRRFVVEYLHERGDPVELDALAAALASEERSDGESEADTDDAGEESDLARRARIASSLYSAHLPKLAEAGVVDFDGETVALRDESAVELVRSLREYDVPRGPADPAEGDIGGAADDATYDDYSPTEDRPLTEVIVDAVVDHRGSTLRRTDFRFYEDVSADALADLFRDDAEPWTKVSVMTATIQVDLWGHDGVQIRVTEPTTENSFGLVAP